MREAESRRGEEREIERRRRRRIEEDRGGGGKQGESLRVRERTDFESNQYEKYFIFS